MFFLTSKAAAAAIAPLVAASGFGLTALTNSNAQPAVEHHSLADEPQTLAIGNIGDTKHFADVDKETAGTDHFYLNIALVKPLSAEASASEELAARLHAPEVAERISAVAKDAAVSSWAIANVDYERWNGSFTSAEPGPTTHHLAMLTVERIADIVRPVRSPQTSVKPGSCAYIKVVDLETQEVLEDYGRCALVHSSNPDISL